LPTLGRPTMPHLMPMMIPVGKRGWSCRSNDRLATALAA
jgi:hypothetical protein